MSDIQADFVSFHEKNPNVYEMLVRLARACTQTRQEEMRHENAV